MWRAILDFILKGANTNAIKALDNSFPIQLAGGEQDPATEFGKAVEWYAELLENCGQTNVQIINYPDCRHETLNETSRDVAVSDFVDWVDKTVDNG